jgi:uncharacterized protein with HEPN domain
MIKDDTVYIGHMLDLSRKVAAKVQAKTRAEFDADENLRLALAHLVQTVGEAARRVSESTQTAAPQVPWRQIMGMRHRIVHDYMNVDEDILCTVVTIHVPALEALLTTLVPSESPIDTAGGAGP